MNGICGTCQSCGMPLGTPEDRGTEGDGTPSAYYCRYCYQDGVFTEPGPRSRRWPCAAAR